MWNRNLQCSFRSSLPRTLTVSQMNPAHTDTACFASFILMLSFHESPRRRTVSAPRQSITTSQPRRHNLTTTPSQHHNHAITTSQPRRHNLKRRTVRCLSCSENEYFPSFLLSAVHEVAQQWTYFKTASVSISEYCWTAISGTEP